MNEMQNAILAMLKGIHQICVDHKLTYYMVGGTMLGAIRHKGFIPWDDDIDISMPRSDYEKFISLPQTELPNWMEINKPEDNEINLGYAKVMNKETTIVEEFRGVRVGGIFIDVFPLDGMGNNYEKCMKRMRRVQLNSFMLRANQGLSTIDSRKKQIMAIVAKRLPKAILYKNLISYATKYSYEDCEYIANTVGAYAAKELTRKDIFGKPRLYEFENASFYGVEKPDEFLSGLYGDYMKLPPEEKRVSQHGVTYINLSLPYREYLEGKR